MAITAASRDEKGNTVSKYHPIFKDYMYKSTKLIHKGTVPAHLNHCCVQEIRQYSEWPYSTTIIIQSHTVITTRVLIDTKVEYRRVDRKLNYADITWQ